MAAIRAIASPTHTGSGAAQYFLPSENELYKAAYYRGGGTNLGYWNYPTQSNTAPNNTLALATSTSNEANYYNNAFTDSKNLLTPVGTFTLSPGPYGSYDMCGDLDQWNETAMTNVRMAYGGAFDETPFFLASTARTSADPTAQIYKVGFRVASSVAVPEPGSIVLLLAGGATILALARRRYAARRA